MSRTFTPIIPRAIFISAVVFSLMALASQARSHFIPTPVSPPSVQRTFNKDIAPIVFQNCAACHHPGGPAPFSLLSFQDVKKRAQQIVAVTESRYMPPWLPEPGSGEFVGARRLSDEQIAVLRQWLAQGAMEGAPADLPPVPRFTAGWQLGPPDLVVRMPQAYKLAADGPDVFRNFVIPIPVATPRYVKAVEILPGNKQVVHHANLLIDRTQSFRRLDAQDQEVGFAGMDVRVESENFEPDSHFLFWKPGTPQTSEPEDMAWQVDKGTDLILNLHLKPSGKPEMIQASIGLYFTDQPPTRFPMLLQLEHDGMIDIPPGKKDFVVTDEFELPVDVDVLGVYPHAHYLGKEIQGFATLPDGTRKWLIKIANWDINWQAVYHYVKPIFLPKGSIISMRYTYDNSAANVRNPNSPPRRVVAGNRSADEMGHLWVQVLPRSRDDVRIVLQEALMRQRLRKYPNDFTAHFNLGSVCLSEGRTEEALGHFRAAAEARPDDALARTNLGAALQALGQIDDAIREFREALRLRPGYANAHYNLGTLLLSQGRVEEAVTHFNEVLRLQPDDAGAHNHLGEALASQGHLTEAAAQFEQALRLNSQADEAHNNLGKVFAIRGDWAQARAHFEEALRINPQHREARENLRRVRAQMEKPH
jgi:Flp pilus assembly protein TadD/mono/diheme cytochrome c family protein